MKSPLSYDKIPPDEIPSIIRQNAPGWNPLYHTTKYPRMKSPLSYDKIPPLGLCLNVFASSKGFIHFGTVLYVCIIRSTGGISSGEILSGSYTERIWSGRITCMSGGSMSGSIMSRGDCVVDSCCIGSGKWCDGLNAPLNLITGKVNMNMHVDWLIDQVLWIGRMSPCLRCCVTCLIDAGYESELLDSTGNHHPRCSTCSIHGISSDSDSDLLAS